MVDSKNSDIGAAGSKCNAILHSLIVAATHNQLLIKIYEGISELTFDSISIAYMGKSVNFPFSKYPKEILKEHKNIVQAIIEKDAKKAQKAMEIHLSKAKERLLIK